MSLGSPAVISSLALALKVRNRPGNAFSIWRTGKKRPRTTTEEEEWPRATTEEDKDMDAAEDDDANQTED